MKTRIGLIVFMVLSFVFSSGCITKAYDGPSLGRGERAILKYGNDCVPSWKVVSINGVEPPKNFFVAFYQFEQFEICPGDTTILMETPWRNSGVYIRFYAKPGSTYEIGQWDKGKNSFTIN